MPRLFPHTFLTVAMFLSVLASSPAFADSPHRHRSPCATRYPSDQTIEWECRTLQRGESLEKLFGEQWTDVARFNRIDRRHAVSGIAIKVPKSLDALAQFTPLQQFILIDLSEQFLGAYEFGALRFALPIASGNGGNETPTGEFRITAAHRSHQSCRYTVEGTDRPYPMNHALRFHINREGVSYWIHGRDLPGYPASHGCIGLYDEPMQKEQYGLPKDPELDDAKRLFEWVLGGEAEDDKVIPLSDGPRLQIVGEAPSWSSN
jgi:hypothetical protein